MNFTEKQIQEYIWENRERWSEMVDEIDYPPLFTFEGEEGPMQVTAEKLLHNIIIRKLSSLYEDTKYLNFLGMEIPMGKQKTGKIRADFLAALDGSPGIYIIELKKAGYSEREAFTELMAYAHSLNSIFPSSCIDDTKFVLIAPVNTNTLKGAFLQSLLFDGKCVCILQPSFSNQNDISTLRLRPYLPSTADISIFSNRAFAKRNFDVEVTCWDKVDGHWNAAKDDPNEEHERRMNQLTATAAQVMESKKIHGFVYTQQSWPEIPLPYPNKLVFVVLNPYKIASDNYIIEEFPDVPETEIPDIYSVTDFANLSDIIKGLKKNHAEIHEEWNYFHTYATVWGSHLMSLGKQVVEEANLNRGGINVHIDIASGGDWDRYEVNSIENIYTFNYEVRPTGILRELYTEMTTLDYAHWNEFDQHPYHGDSFLWASENLQSHQIFSVFLDRLFNSRFDEEPEADDEVDETGNL